MPGRVNYTTLEDVLEGAQAMVGTFSLDDHPVVVLFDFGASHTFISKACAIKNKLKIDCMKGSYNIHSPCGQIITNQITKGVPLNLAGKIFPTQIIILPSPQIDIILV